MKAQDILDYHLGQMDDARRVEFEREMSADPAASDRSTRVATALSLLLDDGPAPEPPANLAARTLRLVRENSAFRARHEWAPLRLPFRWADAAVAAAILLAGLATLVPAISRAKMQAQIVSCASNLQQLGVGLASYAMAQGHYPRPPEALPVGTYGLQLAETGFIPDPTILKCPVSKPPRPRVKLPSLAEFAAMHDKNPKSCDQVVSGEYAYQAGFRTQDAKGEPLPARLAATRPLLADPPPLDSDCRVLAGNSPNHGGGGQNLLFSDNHVEWRGDRRLPPLDADIYLNARQQSALGLHPGDVSLLPATHRVSFE